VTSAPDKTRRAGYAPTTNVGVGRRGLHTRDRILARAAELFLINGFHSTSLDTIAKAANASRATVYQYFAGKEDIFRELSVAAQRDVLTHSEELGELGPTGAGFDELHRWLADWADIYDAHAAVFAEFPGIGIPTGLSVIDVGAVAEAYQLMVTERLRREPLHGMDAHDAAAVLGRIPHMVNLYRHRAMFPLPDRSVVSWSLTVALQLMLFPETPMDVFRAAAFTVKASASRPYAVVEPAAAIVEAAAVPLSPIAQDVLSVSSTLFAERGYYAVGMEEIASAAALSRATLYRYFSTKDRILAELTRRAVIEIEEHAATLPTMAGSALTEWMSRYVRFHRSYRGVIRAWFDGTVAEQLSDAEIDHGINAIHGSVETLLATAELPTGIEPQVAGAVFMAVLGRMTEPTGADAPDTDDRAAELMVNLLRRSLLRA
jgi:AcrR family transcriptional regulator